VREHQLGQAGPARAPAEGEASQVTPPQVAAHALQPGIDACSWAVGAGWAAIGAWGGHGGLLMAVALLEADACVRTDAGGGKVGSL